MEHDTRSVDWEESQRRRFLHEQQSLTGAHVSYSQTLESLSDIRESGISTRYGDPENAEAHAYNVGILTLEPEARGLPSDQATPPLVNKSYSTLHTFTIPNHIHNLYQQALKHSSSSVASRHASCQAGTEPVAFLTPASISEPKLPQVLYGLNISRRRFSEWVQYTLEDQHNVSRTILQEELPKYMHSHMTTRPLDLENSTLREWMRAHWKKRLLVSERTEPLAVYESDMHDTANNAKHDGDTQRRQAPTTRLPEEPQVYDGLQNNSSKKRRTRGGFRDLLSLYADRVLGIILDELEEAEICADQNLYTSSAHSGVHDHATSMLSWLEQEYGEVKVARLKAGRTGMCWPFMNERDQLDEMQSFLDWFRDLFPYYYDRCSSCGASERDEVQDTIISDHDNSPDTQQQHVHLRQDGLDNLSGDNRRIHGCQHNDNACFHDEDEEEEGGSFLGYVYPTPQELSGKAARTELYLCRSCGNFTRFPRYNAASTVLETRRGRCGEYSMLLYRILRALGHEARWVVDWADHVWCEVKVADRWVHLDPCEAAVDKPLLYQEWGKTQTYILAFYAPSIEELKAKHHSIEHSLIPSNNLTTRAANQYAGGTATAEGSYQPSFHTNIDGSHRVHGYDDIDPHPCLVEDVTLNYTQDSPTTLQHRREESFALVDKHVKEVTNALRLKMNELLT
jgi:hypothetical protein